MKIDDEQIEQIASWALHYAGGNPWRAYEYAKREAAALLDGDSPREYDRAVRRLADDLKI
jgi:hypothetical protein